MTQIRTGCAVALLLAVTVASGCGSETSSHVDDAPFRAAIAEYLRAGNMALKIKAIKEGPQVVGDQATLSASLTHEQLGGPSVTWTFSFSKEPDRGWIVISHEG